MSTDDREQGIDFGQLDDRLEQQDYPVTTDELLEEYGEYEIKHSNGTTTLNDILNPLKQENHQYESAEEVRQMIFNMVGTEAVGRDQYSDRGTGEDQSDSI